MIPDPTTRYAALKNGEIDVTYWMTASLGEDLRRTPGLTLRPVVSSVMQWVAFLDQWICQIKQTGTWSRLYGEWIEPITGRNAEPPADQVPAGQLR